MFLLGCATMQGTLSAGVMAGLMVIFLFISYRRVAVSGKRIRIILICLMAFFAAGVLLSGLQKGVLGRALLFYEKDSVSIQGKLYKKEFKNDRYRLYLSDVIGQDGEGGYTGLGRALVFSKLDYEMGSLLVARGEPMELMRAENEGGFDYREYLRAQGVFGAIYDGNVELIKKPLLPVSEWFYDIRHNISEFYGANLPGEEGGLLSAMVLGEKSGLDEDAKDLFQRAGLSHILAISGLHLSIVGMGLMKLLRRLGASFLWSGVISGVAVLLYGLLSGNPISMMRASGMFICMAVGAVLGLAYDMLNALSLMALFLMIQNPFIIGDAGFVLSFGAILGIILVAKPLTDAYGRLCKARWEKRQKTFGEDYKQSFPEKLVQSLLSGLGIQLFTFPLILSYFYSIPVYVIFLNLLVLPLMGVLLVLGLVSGFFYLVFPLFFAHFILFFYEALADIFSSLPGAEYVAGRPEWWVLIIYYIVIYLFARWLERYGKPGKMQGARHISKRIRRMVAVGFGTCVLLLLLLNIHPYEGFMVDMLSVGQGDGIFVQSPKGVRLFIDGGSSSNDRVGKYTILPYLKSRGISRIDHWLITHLDEDHYNGFMEVLSSGYEIDNLILAASGDKTEIYPEIVAGCKRQGVNISFVKRKDRLHAGGMDLIFIYPDSPSGVKGTNENSLSFLLECGDFQGIFTGDLGSEGEKAILSDPWFNNLIEGKDIELFKAAHHGSKNSNSGEWMEAISPKLVIISAGKSNRYGHPSPDALARMEAVGADWLCTAQRGRIRVLPINGGYRAESML